MPLQLGRDFRTNIKPAQNVDLQCSLWSLSTQPACPTSTLPSYASPKFFQRSRQGGKISKVPLFLGLHNKCWASQSFFVRPGLKTTKHPTLMEGGMARCGCPHPYSQHLGNWGRRIMSLKSAWLHREYETWPEETFNKVTIFLWILARTSWTLFIRIYWRPRFALSSYTDWPTRQNYSSWNSIPSN